MTRTRITYEQMDFLLTSYVHRKAPAMCILVSYLYNGEHYISGGMRYDLNKAVRRFRDVLI